MAVDTTNIDAEIGALAQQAASAACAALKASLAGDVQQLLAALQQQAATNAPVSPAILSACENILSRCT